VVRQLELSSTGTGGDAGPRPHRRRQQKTEKQQSGEGHADMLVVDRAWEDSRALSALQRTARRLRVPCKDCEWVAGTLLAGSMPAEDVPCERRPMAQHKRGSRGAGQGPVSLPAAAAALAADLSAPSSGLPAAHPQLAATARVATPSPASALLGSVALSARPSLCMASGLSAEWVSPPIEDASMGAAGGDLAAGLRHRTHYAAFKLLAPTVSREGDGPVLRLGDCALLAPQPGEVVPQVVRLEALWEEVPSDGRRRMLARCRRFYRPEVRSTHSHSPLPIAPVPGWNLSIRAHSFAKHETCRMCSVYVEAPRS
jgi:hypothetical protein